MRRVYLCALAAPLLISAQDRPLTSLPYTPSLDVSFIDRAVDPCQDFYRFACGTWNKQNPIPPDQARWDVYGKLETENLRFLWGILEEAAVATAGRTSNQQKIGDYFSACMDQQAVERAGTTPLAPRLAEIGKLARVSDLPVVLAHLHLAADDRAPLFAFSSSQDYADSSHVIAFAFASGLGLPDRDYYVNTDAKSQETRARYLEHIVKTFELTGDSAATAQSEAQTVMDIETALARASLTRVDKRDPYKMFHKLTSARLAKLTPSFNWSAYFRALGIPAQAVVNVTEPKFFEEVERQLKTRSIADWKTYLRWHLTREQSRYLSSAFVNADFDFYNKYLRGVSELQPRWKRCVRFVDRDLGEALGEVFVEKTFTADTKGRALAMTREIEEAMQGDLEQLTWMSPDTKKQALAKLHATVNKIGYPERWRDYSSLTIRPGEFLEDVDRAIIFESRRQLNKIGKPVDRTEWEITPPTVNAYYDPQMNDINFPAGVLQPPLFDARMDDAPNYGNTGATIGHELTHGFDDEGRQFDAHGNLKDWWTPEDAKRFEERAACVVKEYGQFTVVDDVKLNSKLTEGEDVADLGGTLLAYIAWKNATRALELKPIDGFTPDQRFFIGMAQWACGDERPESKRVSAITNPHSPLEDRINGVVSNMPEFQKAFACKAGQPMVRAEACRVW
ncbi:MAG: M13 family metallopeptidase [Acidobacteriia bacterium]|nr:M13 family metallopeptidase [Terriglobia bacterium]